VLLRSDLNRLFDRGLVTIEPERLTFRVSERIRDEYSIGWVYDELEGKPLTVLPERPDERPNRQPSALLTSPSVPSLCDEAGGR